MDSQSFQDEVLFRAPPHVSRGLLTLLSQGLAELGEHGRGDVVRCIRLAAWLQEASLEVPQAGIQGSSIPVRAAARPTPEMRLRSAQLRDQIDASVRAVRQALFGQPSAPFASLSDAIEWMEGEVRHLYDGIEPWARVLYQPLWDHALKPSPRIGEPGAAESSQRLAMLLDAMQAGVIGSIAPAEPGGLDEEGHQGMVDAPACRLQRYIRQLARASGFSPPAVAAYVLADVLPILEAYTIDVDSLTVPLPFGGADVQRNQVTITVHARDLSYQEHRKIFRQVRQELQLVRAHGLTDEDIEFLQLVKSLGVPPKGWGSGPYWTHVQRTWNRKHREDRFQTPDGPRMWYRRLQEKLKALGLDGLRTLEAPPPPQKSQ
jgi:hypothetical protein